MILIDFPYLIKTTRLGTNENQTIFGRRFNVSHAAVSDWETGKTEAPYKVLSYIIKNLFNLYEKN